MTTHSTQCPPGIATLLTSIERKGLFKITATVVAVGNDSSVLCRSQAGMDILEQEMSHLRHVRPVKLDKTQLQVGCPILLQNNKRAEIVDVQKKEVYLYDEGNYETQLDWRHYQLPKTLLDIPAQVFEVHLCHSHRLSIGDEVSLLATSSGVSRNPARCNRVIYQAAVLKYS